MNFELQVGYFRQSQPYLFQTQDQQATAERMFEFVAEQLQTTNFQIIFNYQNGQQTLLNQSEDLKFYMDLQGQFIIILNQENQQAPPNQSVAICIYNGETNQLIYREYADPNVLLGQYLLYLGQSFNIIADCFSLYDSDGNPLSSDPNEYIRNYRNFQPLNLVLYQQQSQIKQIIPQNQQISNMEVQNQYPQNYQDQQVQSFTQDDQLFHVQHNVYNYKNQQYTQPLIQDDQNQNDQQNQQQVMIGIEAQNFLNPQAPQQTPNQQYQDQPLIQGAQKQPSQSNQNIHQNQVFTQPLIQDDQNQNDQQNQQQVMIGIEAQNFLNSQAPQQTLNQQYQDHQLIQGAQKQPSQSNQNIHQNQQQGQPITQDSRNIQQNLINYQNQQNIKPLVYGAKIQDNQQNEQQTIQELAINVEQKISEIKDSIKIFKNYTLYFDYQGQFVVYDYHKPMMLKGCLRKSSSTSRPYETISKWYSVHQNKFEYAELDEYSFAIKWEGGNLSYIKIKQL